MYTTERPVHANEHFLWMQGRFVGAEKANRNGVLWSTEDLEPGELTVRNGPLNWLHEARHVIGTIAAKCVLVRDEHSHGPQPARFDAPKDAKISPSSAAR